MPASEVLEILSESPTLRGSRGRRLDGDAVIFKRLAADAGPQAHHRYRHEDELPQIEVALQPPAAIEGSLAYIAPEQTGRTNRRVDYRSDFYSLGANFYRLLTGRPPFEAEDVLGRVHHHITVMPPSPHTLDGKIPAVLSHIVMKLLAKMAEESYQSGAGLKADLERCRRGLAAGVPPDFEPGQEDFSECLQIPQKLYRRQDEIDRLLAVFERAGAGGRQFLLVAGYAGVGKTALVHEACWLIAGKHGQFIQGKFDQLQRSMPHFGWIQAFSGFFRHLLMESETQLGHWRRVIQAAVGSIGGVPTDVIPTLEPVIGPQPEVPSLAPPEAQNRFNYVFRELIKAIATPGHPLVVFLDDLQWIDSTSLSLLKTLLTGPGVAHLLVIGAYRDNEVDALHPLMTGIEELRREMAAVETIELLAEALDKVVSVPDQAWGYRLRVRLYPLSGRFQEAMRVSLEALGQFGFSFPENDEEIRAATEAEIMTILITAMIHK